MREAGEGVTAAGARGGWEARAAVWHSSVVRAGYSAAGPCRRMAQEEVTRRREPVEPDLGEGRGGGATPAQEEVGAGGEEEEERRRRVGRRRGPGRPAREEEGRREEGGEGAPLGRKGERGAGARGRGGKGIRVSRLGFGGLEGFYMMARCG